MLDSVSQLQFTLVDDEGWRGPELLRGRDKIPTRGPSPPLPVSLGSHLAEIHFPSQLRAPIPASLLLLAPPRNSALGMWPGALRR